MRACLCIPPLEEYPWHAVKAGLERIGYDVLGGMVPDCDILVVWSPWEGSHRRIMEKVYREAGLPVVVVENGWLSPLPRAPEPGATAPLGRALEPYYQVALDGWNGSGRFHPGGSERWDSWRMARFPWRTAPGPALIIGQRGHPHDRRTAPPGWHQTLPVPPDCNGVIRRSRDATRALEVDLRGAGEVHVWTSNAASWAVLYGIPVVQHGPNLMVSNLASRPGQPLFRGERAAEFARLAWAQWSNDELAGGEPFARLLGDQ